MILGSSHSLRPTCIFSFAPKIMGLNGILMPQWIASVALL